MYAKLENGCLILPPNPIKYNGSTIYHNGINSRLAEILTESGYMPVIETPYPQTEDETDIKCYKETWVEQDGSIVRVWVETDPPAPESAEPTVEQRVTVLEKSVSSIASAIQEGLNL